MDIKTNEGYRIKKDTFGNSYYSRDITHTGEPVLTTQQLSGTCNQVDPAQYPVSAAGRTGNVSILHAGCLVLMSRTSP
jgi:hypothetical protein